MGKGFDHECAAASDHVAALVGKGPLQAEIALMPRGGIGRNDGNEQRAVVDLTPDLLVPGVPAAQLALVEKHLDARGTQRRANLLGSLCILGGVAQEYCV